MAGALDLAVVDIGVDVHTIGDRAFKGTTGLNRLLGGSGLTSIGTEAFSESTLSGVFPFSNSLAFLGEDAFRGTWITTFHTGSTLTKIGAGAFEFFSAPGLPLVPLWLLSARMRFQARGSLRRSRSSRRCSRKLVRARLSTAFGSPP